jgi:NAD(P)-dependent dehydrogenase (short-subunit alcohol dehydrogenase family)
MNTDTEPKVLGNRLAGKVCIVTGGGSGFGEGISKRFAEEGAKVIVADMDPVGGQRVASYHPSNMHFIKMNVTSEEDWEMCIENTVNKWGRLDCLVNNAGTSYKNKVSSSLSRAGREGRKRGRQRWLTRVCEIADGGCY